MKKNKNKKNKKKKMENSALYVTQGYKI